MGGWNTAGGYGWQVRRERRAGLPQVAGRWTATDIAVTLVAFYAHWEIGVAFLALKLWHQASGHPGSVFAFAHEKWDRLVVMARGLMSGVSLPDAGQFGPRASGSLAFDAWRRTELERIEAERAKLRVAEREFASYRDELLQARDREHFDHFMRSRKPD